MQQYWSTHKEKLRELLRYGVSGVCVTGTNIGLFNLLFQLGMVYTVANLIALIAAKVVGYGLNKFWVFGSKTASWKATLTELLRYIGARGLTGLVDYFGLILLVEAFHVPERLSKLVITGVVIVLNYVLGKKLVFLKKEDTGV